MEDTYLFNPFITKGTDEEIATAYRSLQNALLDECDAPREYAHNIEVYANMNYLVGEMIARYTYKYTTLKTEIKIKESKSLYEERTNWSKLHKEKAPAVSYFEAIATASVKDSLDELAKMECNLRRFKNAYESIQDKSNALKKQMEAIKYEMWLYIRF